MVGPDEVEHEQPERDDGARLHDGDEILQRGHGPIAPVDVEHDVHEHLRRAGAERDGGECGVLRRVDASTEANAGHEDVADGDEQGIDESLERVLADASRDAREGPSLHHRRR